MSIAYNNLGSVKRAKGAFKEAIEEYSLAIKMDSSMYMAFNNRGFARYKDNDFEGAVVDYKKAIVKLKEGETIDYSGGIS